MGQKGHLPGSQRCDQGASGIRLPLLLNARLRRQELLVIKRGWTPERYGQWVGDTFIATLLEPANPPPT